MADRVAVSMDKLVDVGRRLGSQDVDACPPERDCWRKRHPDEYAAGDIDECPTCWVAYLLGVE